MYNRYIPDGASYSRILEEDGPPYTPPIPHPGPQGTPEEAQSPQQEFVGAPQMHGTPVPPEAEEPEKKTGGLSALLKGLKLEDLDTGDILLLLIMLFLFLEGDDIELIITLGLMLLLGLD